MAAYIGNQVLLANGSGKLVRGRAMQPARGTAMDGQRVRTIAPFGLPRNLPRSSRLPSLKDR
jgi:hypothetical protein